MLVVDPVTSSVEPTVVVSVTLSAGAILTALGTLFRVARWIGHTDAMQSAQTQRLEEIRQDVREIRAVLLERTHQ